MNRRRFLFFLITLTLFFTLPVMAAEEAHSVNDHCDMRIYGERADTLLDGNLRSHSKLHYGTEITLSSSELIGSLYLEFSQHPGEWTLLYGDKTLSCGGSGFLHEYVTGLNTYSLTLRFHDEGILANVYALSPGEKPAWVQDWQPCHDRADVLLLPTHSDDDTIFFGGIIPWCIDKGARVQVAYLISHNDEPYRRNELLNGLWTSGLRHYPVLGEYEDKGAEPSLPLALYERDGIRYEDMLLRTVRLYRRFKPHVVICHDSAGEYGHGAHKLYSKLATEALALAGDSSVDPEGVTRRGVWIPEKLYVHLQTERSVVIDLDEPLRSFDYQTGYDLAKKSFECHESQVADFAWYFWGAPTAAELRQYSSREYGLFYSSVGDDISGNSFFDNLTLYDELPSPAEETPPPPPEETQVPTAPVAETPTVSAPAENSSRVQEIRQEQRRLALSISALTLLIAVLLLLLTKIKNTGKEGK